MTLPVETAKPTLNGFVYMVFVFVFIDVIEVIIKKHVYGYQV